MRPRQLVLLAALLAGCGGGGNDIALPAPPDATLVVESTYSPGPGGVLYTEGALSEVVLTDEAGSVRTERGPVEEELRFEGLPPGRYVVRPALRPCVGNCGHLDGRTDGCEVVVDVPETARIEVDHVVAEPCTARPVG